MSRDSNASKVPASRSNSPVRGESSSSASTSASTSADVGPQFHEIDPSVQAAYANLAASVCRGSPARPSSPMRHMRGPRHGATPGSSPARSTPVHVRVPVAPHSTLMQAVRAQILARAGELVREDTLPPTPNTPDAPQTMPQAPQNSPSTPPHTPPSTQQPTDHARGRPPPMPRRGLLPSALWPEGTK